MQRRARSRSDKESRRREILASAKRVWAGSSFDEITMEEVARCTGLAKGTLYLYFPTKEALLLALLEMSLERWFVDVTQRFSGSRVPIDPDTAAANLKDMLLADDALPRLLAILGSILEHNIPAARIRRFKRWLLKHLQRTGRCLEERFGFLAPNEGVHLLLQLQALVAGVSQLAWPAPAVARVIASPELKVFQIDFAQELQEMVATLLRGRAQRAATPRRSTHPPRRAHRGKS